MAQTDPLMSIHEAAYRHAFEDGITEILAGILLAAGALLTLRSGGGVVILAVALGLMWALPRLRDRVTTPRTGSASLPMWPGRTIWGILVYGILAALAVLALRTATVGYGAPLGEYRWLPLFTGLFLSGGFVFAARKTRLKRFYFYILAAVGGGLLLAVTMNSGTRLEAYWRLTALLWGLSGLLLLIGTVTLVRFIRRNAIVAGEIQGGSSSEH